MKEPININYCATIVEITKLIPIENANKIQTAIILGNSVVVSKDLEPGTRGLYFPLECQIMEPFLRKHNLFRDKTKNIDTNASGFFEANGRVRAVALRGTKSEGFFIPFYNLHEAYKEFLSLEVGTDFDYFQEECICQKYVVAQKERKERLKQGKAIVLSRLVDNQFHLHIDTIQAKKNFHKIYPNDIISITDKWHGTSAVFANVLINKKQKWWQKLLKIQETEYGNVYSSRKVIKNPYINENVTGFETDIWGIVNTSLKDLIPKGISIYGEIVGYIPGGKVIQGGYTYGCQPNTHRFLVYRVTNTTMDGHVTEYSWGQIKEFCIKYGLEHVKELYYGYAKDLYSYLPVDEEWNETVLSLLVDDFNLEKECKYNNGMPAEGIVIRKDSLYSCEPMKLKSFAFLKHETLSLDKGEIDIEEDG